MNPQQAYYIFVDAGIRLVQDFYDSPEHAQVANTIFQVLIHNLDAPNRVANPDQIYAETLERLVNESRFTRSLIRGFCVQGGVYRAELDILLEKYDNYLDIAM